MYRTVHPEEKNKQRQVSKVSNRKQVHKYTQTVYIYSDRQWRKEEAAAAVHICMYTYVYIRQR
jgi:hypothetical protein